MHKISICLHLIFYYPKFITNGILSSILHCVFTHNMAGIQLSLSNVKNAYTNFTTYSNIFHHPKIFPVLHYDVIMTTKKGTTLQPFVQNTACLPHAQRLYMFESICMTCLSICLWALLVFKYSDSKKANLLLFVGIHCFGRVTSRDAVVYWRGQYLAIKHVRPCVCVCVCIA